MTMPVLPSEVMVFQARVELLKRLPIHADTLDETTLQVPHGMYTSFRLYPGRLVMRLNNHLNRLVDSGKMLGSPLAVTPAWLRTMLRRVVVESGIDVPAVRITIPFEAPDTAIFALAPFAPPPEQLYVEGAHVVTLDLRRNLPRAKDSRFVIARRRALKAALDGGYEGILRSPEGELLEGTSSNFYAILDGVLHTAREGMLEGVARSLLLEVAPGVLPVELTPVRLADVPRLSEAMITSSSRAVMPVVQIDDMLVGTGVPGSFYRQLHERYQARLKRELEPL